MHYYQKPRNAKTRWISFENSTVERAQAAQENKGAKGHPFEPLRAGETKTLLDIPGSGIVNRMWITIIDRSPKMLRGLRVDMYWDGCDKPAVSCPFGDFFNVSLGRCCAFQSELFANPEGRSFNCFVPMPFRNGARITLTNETDKMLSHLFYDINLLVDVDHGDDVLYFHTHWRRENPNALGQDFTILPQVRGSGRFLGCNYGVIEDPIYEGLWWGEGEMKVYFGDDTAPTLCGTGAEDYPGSAWGLGAFNNLTQGCLLADREKGLWSVYRQHTVDPVYFDDACRVTLQTMGGAPKEKVLKAMDKGAAITPVSIAPRGETPETIPFFENDPPTDLRDPSVPDGAVNFWRQDDWSGTAYFYLDAPQSDLPPLAPLEERLHGLTEENQTSAKRLDQ